MKKLLLLTIAAAGFALAQKTPVVIQNATIHTVTQGSYVGSIAFQDGKIVTVGAKILTPPNAVIIPGDSMHVTPGIIDSHSHIAVEGFGVNESSVSVSSMVQIRDVLDPDDIAIYRALAGGVTIANVLHGSANAIGGNNQLIKLRWGKPAAAMVMEGATPSIKFALGENPKRAGNPTPGGFGGGFARYPATRMGIEDIYREAFTEARAYRQAWADHKAGKLPMPPKRDLKLEPLVEVLEGKRLVHCHAYRADEMLMMLRVAEEFGFKITSFEHVQEGYKVAKEMAKHGVAGAGFSDWWGYKMEVIDGIPHNMALMTKKGVLSSINSDSAELMRRLNTEAAKTMKYGGLTEDQAMALITINPARHLKVDHLVGSLDVGKSADIVIWNKHPLSTYAVAQKVFIDGEIYFDRDKDLAQRTEKDLRRKALEEKLRKEQPPEQKKALPSRKQGGNQGGLSDGR
jgi:imidazolonepropionase-like amidohydrolase